MNNKLRAKIFERDRFRCRGCAKQAEEIHHIIFRSQGGTDDEANLVAICRDCHDLAHGKRSGVLPAWVLQAMLFYDKFRVCCGIWKYFVEQRNCITCESRSADYVCLITNEKVDPSYGCESWGLRSLTYHC